MFYKILYEFLPFIISYAEDSPTVITSVIEEAKEPVVKTSILGIFSSSFDFLLKNNIIESIYDAIAVIGLLIMIIYFLIDLLDGVIKEQLNVEIIIKHFLKFLLGAFIVFNIGQLLIGMNDTVIAITDDVNTVALNLANVKDDELNVKYPDYSKEMPLLYTTTLNKKFLSAYRNTFPSMSNAQLTLYSTIMIYLSAGLLIVMEFVAYSRSLYFALYYLLSPILVADAFSRGISGVTAKIKIVLALLLQVPVTIFVIYIGDIIIYNLNNKINFANTFQLVTLVMMVLGIFRVILSSKKNLRRIMQ